VVELHLAKVVVEGSNPFARSNYFCQSFAVYHDGSVAQLVEQLTLNQRVRGSSPRASTSLRSERSGERRLPGVVVRALRDQRRRA
jgi:hypothetical protein